MKSAGMKKKYLTLFAILLLAGFCPVAAQHFQPVASASTIKFIIQNLGMGTEGSFSGISGNIQFTPAALKSASFLVSIDARSINTGIDVRDSVLLNADYLQTDQYPEISIQSKQITADKAHNRYYFRGILHLKGIHKEITFPFTANTQKEGTLFTGEFTIRRSDFSIGKGSLVLSENIVIYLKVFARKV